MDWHWACLLTCLYVLLSDRPKKLACCVKYTTRPISKNDINGVTIQDSRGPCRLNAIMWVHYTSSKLWWNLTETTFHKLTYIYLLRFHTTTMDICATSKDSWVKRILQQLRYSNVFMWLFCNILNQCKYLLIINIQSSTISGYQMF